MSKFILFFHLVFFLNLALGSVVHRVDYDDDDDSDNEVEECIPSASLPSSKSQCCGVDLSSSNRIIGGKPTDIYQFPWMVLLEERNKETNETELNCGGSLISGAYVLTAAHCVEKYEIINVVLGEYDTSNNGKDCVTKGKVKTCISPAIKIGVDRIIIHEYYDEDSTSNDIALIKLKKLAPYTDTIRPICLPTKDVPEPKIDRIWFYMSGWGVEKQTQTISFADQEVVRDTIGESSDVKQYVQLAYVPLEKCREEYVQPIETKQICAGGVIGRSICFGDSGGPLMYEREGIFEQVGIASFSVSPDNVCGVTTTPNVFTKVFKYMDWIKKRISKYSS